MTSAVRNPVRHACLVAMGMLAVACTGGLPGTSSAATSRAPVVTQAATPTGEATTPSDVACTIVTEAEVESLATYGYPRVRTEVSDDGIQCTYYFEGDHVGALVGVAISSFTSVAELDEHVDGTLDGIETDYNVTREQLQGLGDEAWFIPETDYQADVFVRVGLRLIGTGAGAGQAAAITMDQGKQYAIKLAQLAIPRLP
jgi:hypothetical protein